MYRRVNATADNYHACCGYLISLTKAAIDIIEQNKKDVDVMKHFSDTKDSAVMSSQLVHFVYTAAIPFCNTLTAVRSGNYELFRKCVISNIPLFLATKKKNYSYLSVHFIWTTSILTEKALEIYKSNLWFFLTLQSKFYSANDDIIENVSK